MKTQIEGILSQKSDFGLFSERVLELLNHSFSGMYHGIFKEHWHNSFVANMNRNYVSTDWKNGVYEVFIPTFSHAELNMNYYRVVVKVIPEADRMVVREEAENIHAPICKPLGVIDSETMFIVAPRRTLTARKQRQFVYGLRKSVGHMVCPIICNVPEICVKRILVLVSNFIRKRLRKMLESFNLENHAVYYREERLYYITNILASVSWNLSNALQCLSKTLSWVIGKLKMVYGEIGRQNVVKECIWEVARKVRKVRFQSPKYIQRKMPEIEALTREIIMAVYPSGYG